MSPALKKLLAFSAKLAISAAGIWFVITRYDLGGRLPAMLGHDQEWLLLGVLFCFAQIAAAGLRWQCILRALELRVPTGLVLRVFYVTAFLNSFLPAGLAGDMIRVWLLRDNPGGLMMVVNSVLIDRIVVVLTLFIAAAFAQPAIWMQWGRTTMMVLVVGSAMAMVVCVCAAMFIGPRIRLRRFAWLTATLHRLSDDLRRVFLRTPAVSSVTGAAFASNLLLVVAVYFLGQGLDIRIAFVDWLVAMPIVLLVTALPISIGGWGTREIAMIYMLGLFGVPGVQAASVSIEFGLCSTLASLLGAPIWMTLRQQRGSGNRE